MSEKRKMGRPPSDPEGPLGGKLGFRPKKSVRDYLDKKVEYGEAVNIGTAINEAIDRLQDLEMRQRDSILRAYGGIDNFAIGWLVSRIALSIHSIHGKTWKEDPRVLFIVLLVAIGVIRQFFPEDWFEQDFDINDPKNRDILDSWSETVLNLLTGLRNPDFQNWPLHSASPVLNGFPGYDNSAIDLLPVSDAVKTLFQAQKFENPFSVINTRIWVQALQQDIENITPFIKNKGFDAFFFTQEKIDKSNRDIEDYSSEELEELIAECRDQLAKKKNEKQPDKTNRKA